MKKVIFLFLVCNCFSGTRNLNAQEVLEIYLSSNDCVKCISGISGIIELFEKNKFAKNRLKIFTDFKSNKKKILSEFNYLEDSLVFCDKELIATVISDSRSKYVIKKGKEILETKYITDIKTDDLAKIESIFKNIDEEDILLIPDTVFEKGNFTKSIGGNNIALFQKASQTYLIIPLYTTHPDHFYYKISENKQSYEELRSYISLEKKMNLINYDSAIALNQKNKLPLSTIASHFVDEDTLFQYKNVYFYQREDGGNILNRGYVFLEKQLLEKGGVKSLGNYLISPFVKGDDTWVPFLFYSHQQINKGEYFTYYSHLSGSTDGKKLDHTYFGGIYSIGKSGMDIQKDFKFDVTGLPDSVQGVIKKYSYGNNPKYFSFKGGNYVLYKNFAQVLDLESGKLSTLSDFIKHNFHCEVDKNEFYFIWDVYCDDHSLKIAYYNETAPGLLFVNYLPDQPAITKKISVAGDPDSVSINDRSVLTLRKLDDEGLIEVRQFYTSEKMK